MILNSQFDEKFTRILTKKLRSMWNLKHVFKKEVASRNESGQSVSQELQPGLVALLEHLHQQIPGVDTPSFGGKTASPESVETLLTEAEAFLSKTLD